jgi:hypothetical protein
MASTSTSAAVGIALDWENTPVAGRYQRDHPRAGETRTIRVQLAPKDLWAPPRPAPAGYSMVMVFSSQEDGIAPGHKSVSVIWLKSVSWLT